MNDNNATSMIYIESADRWYNFEVLTFKTLELMHRKLKWDGLWGHADENTIAFTDTQLPVKRVVGRIYLLADCDIDTMAHEATHAALHVMSLQAWTNIPIVKAGERAPEVEESLCYLVGSITTALNGLFNIKTADGA